MRALTTEEFDTFVAGLDYPVFVVTAAHGSSRAGCLAGFVTQASIDPPRLLVCLSKANHTWAVAEHAEFLAVHVLDGSDHPLAERFGGESGDEVDKFADLPWRPGPDGLPLLEELPRCLVGRVLARHDFGDHVGHLLEPVAEHENDEVRSPLSLQDVADVEPGHPA